jgi:hypothetical protein
MALPTALCLGTVSLDFSRQSHSCFSRGAATAGYCGYLQVDGYAGYEQTSATLAGCWAHARRKLIEAQQGKGETGKADWTRTIPRSYTHWKVN